MGNGLVPYDFLTAGDTIFSEFRFSPDTPSFSGSSAIPIAMVSFGRAATVSSQGRDLGGREGRCEKDNHVTGIIISIYGGPRIPL